jgi:hypothetical protein
MIVYHITVLLNLVTLVPLMHYHQDAALNNHLIYPIIIYKKKNSYKANIIFLENKIKANLLIMLHNTNKIPLLKLQIDLDKKETLII